MENEAKRLRTKQELKDALMALCGEKRYFQITVQDICDKAGYNRSTFYRYYDSTDEMLREIEQDYIKDLRNLVPTIITSTYEEKDDIPKRYHEEIVRTMEYHLAHRELAKFLLSSDGDPYFLRILTESLHRICVTNLKRTGKTVGINEIYQLVYFIKGYLGIVEHWVRFQDCSASEAADIALKMLKELKIYRDN